MFYLGTLNSIMQQLLHGMLHCMLCYCILGCLHLLLHGLMAAWVALQGGWFGLVLTHLPRVS
jgi:hypothetical protein